MKNNGTQNKPTTLHSPRPASYGRVILRYTLLQIPSLVILILILIIIQEWIHLPGWLVGLCIGAWIVKDLVLFPFVWRAYDHRDERQSNKMIGKQARVVERLDPQGYVEINGELWKAVIEQEWPSVEKNAPVRVLDVHGLTLIVEPEVDAEPLRDLDSKGRKV